MFLSKIRHGGGVCVAFFHFVEKLKESNLALARGDEIRNGLHVLVGVGRTPCQADRFEKRNVGRSIAEAGHIRHVDAKPFGHPSHALALVHVAMGEVHDENLVEEA